LEKKKYFVTIQPNAQVGGSLKPEGLGDGPGDSPPLVLDAGAFFSVYPPGDFC